MEKRRRLTPAERRAVYDKMGGRCAYCGEQLNYDCLLYTSDAADDV